MTHPQHSSEARLNTKISEAKPEQTLQVTASETNNRRTSLRNKATVARYAK